MKLKAKENCTFRSVKDICGNTLMTNKYVHCSQDIVTTEILIHKADTVMYCHFHKIKLKYSDSKLKFYVSNQIRFFYTSENYSHKVDKIRIKQLFKCNQNC